MWAVKSDPVKSLLIDKTAASVRSAAVVNRSRFLPGDMW